MKQQYGSNSIIRKLNALEAEAYYLGQAKNILFDAVLEEMRELIEEGA